MKCRPIVLALWLGLGVAVTQADDALIVEHRDPLTFDQSLTLPELIDQTLKHYPNSAVIEAKWEESKALERRGNSLLAGAPSITLRYEDDQPGDNIGSREIEGDIEFPIWRWGQRSAGQALAEQARDDARLSGEALRHFVAGQVREALWDLALEDNRLDLARQVIEVSEKLVQTVRRRVELGDLPRADLLLAQSDHLQKRSALAQAEAELMHARKRYSTLTQLQRAPASFQESLSSLQEIPNNHPALAAANALVARRKAELRWTASAGSGQPTLAFGAISERDDRHGDDIESVNVQLSLPFGGSAHAAPAIAAVNLTLTEAMAARNALLRQLEQELHEARHALEVDSVEQGIANERKNYAESYLKMSRISFESGEIKLIDLLKVQANAQAAIRDAQERSIILQRDIARYNQAVGAAP